MIEHMGMIERQVFKAYWDDGLLDLFVALGVLLIGIFWVVDVAVGAAIAPALFVPLWNPVRRRIVEPRLGVVEFTDKREQRTARVLRLILYIGMATLVVGVGTYFLRSGLSSLPPTNFIAALPALILALMAAVVSALVSAPRFLAYGMMLAAAGGYGVLNDWRPGMILATAGVAMFAAALFLFVRFLARNPLDDGEAS